MNSNSNSNSNLKLTLTQNRLAALIAASKGKLVEEASSASSASAASYLAAKATHNNNNNNSEGTNLTLGGYSFNSRQSMAIRAAQKLESFCLIGSAGTGKTTTVREIAKILTTSPEMTLVEDATKVLKQNQAGIICVSFTNIAVQNIASQMEGAVTCSTIHNLLEFKPTYLETLSDAGIPITKRIFEPSRTRYNPLPRGIRCVIIEESGVVGTRLFQLLLDALQDVESICFIFLGDLNQLPPVFDRPILGVKLLSLPIIELTEVYRQALLSPILNLATRVKEGEQLSEHKLKELGNGVITPHGTLAIKFFKSKVDVDSALHMFQAFMENMLTAGTYNPEDTMVLIPYNVGFGTIEANRIIQHLLDKKEGRTVYEVIAGFNKLYLAEGDIIYSRKRKAVITKITLNGKYLGKQAAKPSATLDRWGIDSSLSLDEPDILAASRNMLSVDEIMAQLESTEEVRKEAASHLVDIRILSGEAEGEEDTLTTAAELNELIGGYALTIHKAMGSEWTNGICWLHNSHAKFVSRELLYTMITRFKSSLMIVAEKDTFMRGVKNQALKGTTLEEKLISLKQKLKEAESS